MPAFVARDVPWNLPGSCHCWNGAPAMWRVRARHRLCDDHVGVIPSAGMPPGRHAMVMTVAAPVDADLLRLRNEFVAMPGLCLTVRQTARLLAVREPKARALLDALIAERFLVRNGGGLYRRVVR
jgi:hypothetical protein